MTNVLIWGLGVEFGRHEKELYNMVRIYALNVYLTAKEAPRYTGGTFIPVTKIQPHKIDYVIVTPTKFGGEIIQNALQIGFLEKQIINLVFLQYMRWDWINTVHRIACHYDNMGRENNFSPNGVMEGLDDMTIFSYNCSGGFLYHSLGLQFNSPFIKMRVPEQDFLRFLHFPREYMQAPLKLVDEGQYQNGYYPICSLYDIKVHMVHYHDFKQAVAKWEERKQRINWENVFVMMGTDSWQIADEFDRLPYKHKACIVSFATKLKSCITIDKIEEDNLYRMVIEIARGKYPRYYQALLQKMRE